MCRYRDEAWLRERYHEDGLTQADIAEECDVTVRTIRRWMRRHGIGTRDVEGEHHGLHDEERALEVRERISELLSGREFSAETKRLLAEAVRGRTLSAETRERTSRSLAGREKDRRTRRRMSDSTAGTQNPNWKGGYTQRYGAGWATARERALERDGVCRYCGEGGSSLGLDVHHVVPVRLFRSSPNVDLADAHDLSNLVVLCKRCHALVEHGTIDTPTP